jgi:20S proteasome alpha/beta subunit
MANPNIVAVSDIRAKTAGLALTTSTQTIVTNSSGSNKIFKINSLIVANINGSSPADVTVGVLKNGTTEYRLAYTITVPSDATLVVISKDTGIYLEENDSIRCFASANSYLEAICSWEEIA